MDHHQGVVIEYLRATRSRFVNTECLIQLTPAEALQVVKELIGPAEVFLSAEAIGAIRELIREEQHATNDGAERGDYIKKALSLVSSAQGAVIEAAKAELAR